MPVQEFIRILICQLYPASEAQWLLSSWKGATVYKRNLCWFWMLWPWLRGSSQTPAKPRTGNTLADGPAYRWDSHWWTFQSCDLVCSNILHIPTYRNHFRFKALKWFSKFWDQPRHCTGWEEMEWQCAPYWQHFAYFWEVWTPRWLRRTWSLEVVDLLYMWN